MPSGCRVGLFHAPGALHSAFCIPNFALENRCLRQCGRHSQWLDATSQLVGVKYGSANATLPFGSQSGASAAAEWEYDEVGNRLHETGTSGTTTYVTDVTNQYVSVSSVPTVAYSERGDMTQFGNWAYTYDAQGNLIRAHNTQSNTLAKYWRDAFGHRAVKDVDGSKTVFFNVGTTQLEAYDVANSTASSTIHQLGIDSPLAQVSSSGTLTFYHQDWLGNVVLLTSAAGAKVQSYTYDVWGKATGFDASGSSISASAFASRFLYTAREYDVESGLYHYRARAYSPSLGRFLQTDPIDFGGGDVNMLRYVSNNPINTVDPLGLWGINDCWSTPFPPHDELNIPDPHPPGTPGDYPPAGGKGGARAWDHSPGGGGGGGGGFNIDLGVLFAVSDFFAGVGDAFTFGVTNAIREAGGFNDAVDPSSGAYFTGEITGTGLQVALGGSLALRAGAEVSMANRGNAVGKWLSQGKSWRLGASGAKQTPTLRIGAARPPTALNHINLTFFGH